MFLKHFHMYIYIYYFIVIYSNIILYHYVDLR